MKKFLLIIGFILCSFILASPVMADDVDMPASGDLWDNWSADQNFYGTKPVSDEEFDKAVKKVDAKKNKWKNWANKKKIPKGEEFHQSNETQDIENNQGDKATLPVLCVPVELQAGDGVLPIGHYQIKGEKIDGQPVLKFYQAQYMMAQFPATETSDDFDEETISFVKWLPENDNQIKVIYGSMDFNAYAVINIKK